MNYISDFLHQVSPTFVDRSSPSTQSQPPSNKETEVSSNRNSADEKSALTDALTKGSNYKEISSNAMNRVRQLAPNQMAKLASFKEQHSGMIAKLQNEGGWIGVKEQLKDRMTTPQQDDPKSFEEFRNEAVNLTIEVCLETLKSLGFDPPGKHQASGTPGWDSDIDTPFFAPPGMPEEMQVVEKTLFDATMFEIFGTLPGRALDTESYLDHTAAAFKTQDHISSEEGKQAFAYLEINASSLQTLRQLGGVDSPHWEQFKSQQLESCPPESLETLEESFTNVETLQRDVDRGIETRMILENSDFDQEGVAGLTDQERADLSQSIQNEHPEAKTMATMSYKAMGLMGVSKQMDSCKDTIRSLEGKIKNLGKQKQMLPNFLETEWGKGIKNAQSELEKNQIKLASLGLLRTSFFDEGYNTQGAFTKICFNAEGQIHQRAIENFRGDLLSARRSSIEDGSTLVIGRRGSIPPLKLGEGQRTQTNVQQNLSSMRENRAMYLGHFEHKVHSSDLPPDQSAQKAFIATSKYSERMLSSGHAILEEIEEREPRYKNDEVFQSLKNETRETWQTSVHLEQVKRKNQLNVVCAKAALTETLLKSNPGKDPAQLPEKLDTLLNPFLLGGQFHEYKFEESLTPQDHYLKLVAGLEGLDLGVEFDDSLAGEDQLPQTKNREINAILQATAGLSPQDYPAIKPYIKESGDVTLKLINCQTKESIDSFNDRCVNLSTLIDKYALESQVAPAPKSPGDEYTKLAEFWQKACL